MLNDFGTCPSAHFANGKISTPIEKIFHASTLRESRKKFLARGVIFFFTCILIYLVYLCLKFLG